MVLPENEYTIRVYNKWGRTLGNYSPYDLRLSQIPADVIVFKEGDYAVALDGKTKEIIARSADHTEVIQSAINHLTNGGKIYISSGKYSIQEPVYLPADYPTIWIEGAGWDQTGAGGTILENVGDDYIMKVTGGFYTGRIRNMGFKGNESNNGLQLALQGNAGLDNVLIYNFDTGLEVTKFYVATIKDVLVRSCGVNNPAVKFLGTASDDKSDNLYVHGLRFMSCGNVNMYIEYVTLAILIGLGFDPVDKNVTRNIYLKNTSHGIVANSKLLINSNGSDAIGLEEVTDLILSALDIAGPGTGTDTAALRTLSGNTVRILLTNVNIYGFGYWLYNEGAYVAQVKYFGGHAYVGTKTVPHDTEIRGVVGLSASKCSVATFSGDGSATQFKVEHGLVAKPNKVIVTPLSADAKDFAYATADDTYIYFNFDTAPPSGTNNVKLSWYAEV